MFIVHQIALKFEVFPFVPRRTSR